MVLTKAVSALRKSNYWLSPPEIGLYVARLTHLDNSTENRTIAACLHDWNRTQRSVHAPLFLEGDDLAAV